MTYNTTEIPISNCPYTLECQVRDGGGALEEPYVGVWSAHVQPGNTWTGCGPLGLAIPAQVNETPYHGLPKAEDAASPGRGSGESNTFPFGLGKRKPPTTSQLMTKAMTKAMTSSQTRKTRWTHLNK